jgi:nucleoside diphosphate kinase
LLSLVSCPLIVIFFYAFLFHRSDSEYSALREVRFWMDPKGPGASCEIGFATTNILSLPRNTLVGLPTEDTFAMIKPITAATNADAILSIAASNGFQVVSRLHTSLTLSQAQQFYEEHRGKEFYEQLTQYMSSGPIVALHLRRAGAIMGWRHLIGPTNLEKAVTDRPDSIRAKFGIDKTRNAVHGSDSPSSAERELRFFFSFGADVGNKVGAMVLPSPPGPSIPYSLSPVKAPPGKTSNNRLTQSLGTLSRRDIPSMQQYANYEVDPVMQSLLEKVMISRPADVASFVVAELTEMKTKGKNRK